MRRADGTQGVWVQSDIAKLFITQDLESMFVGSGAYNHTTNSINIPIGKQRKITIIIGGTLSNFNIFAYGYKRMGINA